MKVLVAVATRHAATLGIAESIGAALVDAGLEVSVAPVETVTSVEEYDAVVLGSGVYAGRWLKPARSFAADQAAELEKRPTWLFSSGPIGAAGAPPRPDDPGTIKDAQGIAERIGARGHRSFGGRLALADLSLAERLVARVVRSPEGDFRDWEAIQDWARSIAQDLKDVPAAG